MSVRILVDSSAELDKEFCEKNNIELMPNTISFGEQEFIAGETITTSEFYKKLAETKELPKTALINQFRFTEVFKDVQQKGDEMIVLVISKKFTYPIEELNEITSKISKLDFSHKYRIREEEDEINNLR